VNQRAAVLGSPIRHSLSPILHRAAYAELGLDGWTYGAIECDESRLPELLASSAADVVGYSCTMPLKRIALEYADSASTEARAIGAANTLIRSGAGWSADNTDWLGIRAVLSAAGVHRPRSVQILGAGGTAQAALAALPDADHVSVLVRDTSRVSELLAASLRLRRTVTIGALSPDTKPADLVISTLPRGAADPMAGWAWRADQTVLDVVYEPWPTQLAAAALAAGATVLSGAEMLLHQAAAQVSLMTGKTAPVEAMRAALRQAAPDCGV
jgi:shikimate dehydrogenase